MKYVMSTLLCLVIVGHGSAVSQIKLKMLEVNGTENDAVYSTRFPMNTDFIYHPFTDYKYYNYNEVVENERTGETTEQSLDEFEKNRLQVNQKKFQANVYRNWSHGFYIDFPLVAAKPQDSSYVFSVGKYDFKNQTFPLLLRCAKSQSAVNSDHILFNKLKKEANTIKEPKYTGLNEANMLFTPKSMPYSKIDLNVPSSFAETFKQNVINNEYRVRSLIDFDNNFRSAFSNPAFTNDFNERKSAFGYESSPQKAKEEYLYTGEYPIEVFHYIELFYVLKGFRILDKNDLVIFEWMSDGVDLGTWKVVPSGAAPDQNQEK